MSPEIAVAVYALGILALFWLDRETKARDSYAVWIPVAWLALAGSRSVSQWLGLASPMESPGQYLEGNPVDRVVYTGILALGILVLVRRRRQVGRLLRENVPLVIFFLYCAISILWSSYPDVAFKRWTKALGDLVMVLVVLSDREPSAAVKRFLSRTTYLLIPLSILLIKYYPEFGRTYRNWVWTTAYTGVTTNKNSLGMICLLFGLASAWRFLAVYRNRKGTGRVRRLIAHGAVLVMVVWLFWRADSMTALFCFLLGSVVLFASNFSAVVRRPAVIHLLVAAVLLLSLSTLFWGLGAGLVKETTGRDTTTLTERTEIWKLALGMAGNPVVGTGFESFWLGPRLERMWAANRDITQAHNGYLEIYLNLGWIGVALLIVVLAAGYRKVVAAVRAHHEMGNLLLAYFAVAVVYNLTEAAFRMMTPVWILLLLTISGVRERPPAKIRESNQKVLQPLYGAELPEDAMEIKRETVFETL